MRRTIYVVQGSTGEYSGYREWFVCAYHSQEAAEKHVQLASEVAVTLVSQAKKGLPLEDCEGMNPWDPGMNIDYVRTDYEAIPLEIYDGEDPVEPTKTKETT